MPLGERKSVIAPFDTNRFPTVLTEEDLQTTDLRHHLGQVDAAAAKPSKEAMASSTRHTGATLVPKARRWPSGCRSKPTLTWSSP